MGNDDKGKGAKEVLAEGGNALVSKVYDDAAKSAVVQVGKTLGLAVEVALSPVNLILDGVKVAMGRLSTAVERKLSGIPPDRVFAAPATIAAPAALHYALLGEGEEVADLRKMFENLLAAAMDRDTASSAHPAFVSMISQLTPDEARILKSIDRDTYEYFDLGKSKGLQTVLGLGLDINEGQNNFYIANLTRLGIIQLHTGACGDYKDASSELIQLIESRFPIPDVDVFAGRQSLLLMQVTPLGQHFLDTCVRPRAR